MIESPSWQPMAHWQFMAGSSWLAIHGRLLSRSASQAWARCCKQIRAREPAAAPSVYPASESRWPNAGESTAIDHRHRPKTVNLAGKF
ncbi:MAG: hypothetical protein CBB71_12615 [Rhodopirellula sp. TMED11]|nr:MAG: hypothetical protein CBB71_12615 [Rhodopirellula sp. TMED11]